MIQWEVLAVGTAVFGAEIGLIFTMRAATKEIRAFRTEVPRMLGAFGGLSLLLEGFRTYKQLPTEAENGVDGRTKKGGSNTG